MIKNYNCFNNLDLASSLHEKKGNRIDLNPITESIVGYNTNDLIKGGFNLVTLKLDYNNEVYFIKRSNLILHYTGLHYLIRLFPRILKALKLLYVSMSNNLYTNFSFSFIDLIRD